MRAVLQRVSKARVAVAGEGVAEIGIGILVLVGVQDDDEPADAAYLARKIAEIRIFPGDGKPMNRSVAEAGGDVLVVSQFTLLADTKRGRRPGFTRAAHPGVAEPLVRAVAGHLRSAGLTVGEGIFGADMAVEMINDGPVTILLDSKER